MTIPPTPQGSPPSPYTDPHGGFNALADDTHAPQPYLAGAQPHPTVYAATSTPPKATGLSGAPLICLLFSLLLVVVAFILGIIACVQPKWLKNTDPNLYSGATHWYGLWKECIGIDKELACTKDGFDIYPKGYVSGIKAVRAFNILALIFGAFSFFTGIAFVLAAKKGSPRAKTLSNTYSYNINWAALCYMIAFFVFLGITRKGYKHGQDHVRVYCDDWCKYGPDFWLVLAAWLLNALTSWIICFSGCCIMMKAAKHDVEAPPPPVYNPQPQPAPPVFVPPPPPPVVAPPPPPIVPVFVPAPAPTPVAAPTQPPTPEPLETKSDLRPFFGADIKMLDDAYGNRDNVVTVDAISPGGSAEKVHLQPEDIIKTYNGIEMDSREKFKNAVMTTPIGSTVHLGIVRKGHLMHLDMRMEGTNAPKKGKRVVHSSNVASGFVHQ